MSIRTANLVSMFSREFAPYGFPHMGLFQGKGPSRFAAIVSLREVPSDRGTLHTWRGRLSSCVPRAYCCFLDWLRSSVSLCRSESSLLQRNLWLDWDSRFIVILLQTMLFTGQRYVEVDVGDWVCIEEAHFHFHLKFIFDRLSVPFCDVGLRPLRGGRRFARRYLHREVGYRRFFLLYAIFLTGMVLFCHCRNDRNALLGLGIGWTEFGTARRLFS